MGCWGVKLLVCQDSLMGLRISARDIVVSSDCRQICRNVLSSRFMSTLYSSPREKSAVGSRGLKGPTLDGSMCYSSLALVDASQTAMRGTHLYGELGAYPL